jgi:glutathione S-transferase
MATLTLISHKLCPYVQRAAISLAEKGIPFERVDIDLSNKPDWFLDISPLGKVPLLKVDTGDGEAVIFESAVILEYLEETQPNPLYPSDPLERARLRGWMEFGSAMLSGISRLYNAKDEAAFDKEALALRASLERLEAERAGRPAGPYFNGEAFGLVDAVFGPVFRYFDTFEAQAGLSLMDGLPALAEWRAGLAARPSVRDAVRADYPELLTEFLRNRNARISRMIEDAAAEAVSGN